MIPEKIHNLVTMNFENAMLSLQENFIKVASKPENQSK